MNFAKLALGALAPLTLFSGCAKTSDDSSSTGDGGSSGPTLAARYKRNCTSLGATLHGATHTDALLLFAHVTYTNSQSFYSDSSCNTEVYRMVIGGSYVIGSATTTPANGYLATFTPTSTSITADSSGAATTLNTDCGISVPTSSPYTLNTTNTGFNCSALGFVAHNIATYNVIVIDTSLNFGAVFQSNLGQVSQGSVATTTSLSYIGF